MRETPTAISAEQRLLRLPMAIEDAGLARGCRFEAVGFLDTHDIAPADRLESRAGSSRSTTVRQIPSATVVFCSVVSITIHRSSSAALSRLFASRNASM